MESKYDTVISNKRIYDYYKKNTGINIETMNLILLDFIEQLSIDMTTLLQNTFQGQIMAEVKDMKQQITSLQESLFTKIIKTNDEFIEKTKMVISISTNDNKEHISQLLNKNTDLFIERLNLIIPKGNDEINKKIQDEAMAAYKDFERDWAGDIKNISKTAEQKKTARDIYVKDRINQARNIYSPQGSAAPPPAGGGIMDFSSLVK